MGACELPKDLVRGRSRIQAWRGRRRAGSRIPRALCELAVGLAQTHGVSRTAMTLGLDYYSLKKQTMAAAAKPSARDRAFVELPPPLIGKQCLLELDNQTGATMRLQLVGYDAAEVEALARGLWNAE